MYKKLCFDELRSNLQKEFVAYPIAHLGNLKIQEK